MSSGRSRATAFGIVSVAFASAAMFASDEALGQVPTAERAPLEAQASRTASFDIAAQPLAQALTAFGRQSGLQIAVNSVAVAGKMSGSVTGTMNAEQALRLLLAGTGVSYRFTSDNAVTVSAAPDASGAMQLDPVQVQGVIAPSQAMIDNTPPPYAGGQVATGGQLGILGNRDVMDTPFNQTSYTALAAQDQQAQSVRDVLINDPSIRESRPTGNNGSQNVSMRGFNVEVGGDGAFNGLFGLLPPYFVAVELAERIEVLKGPAAMLFGMPPGGSIGGTINVVPKRAGEEPLTRFTASYISDAQFGGAVDVGRRFGPEKQFGARFNGVFRAGQTAVQWNSD